MRLNLHRHPGGPGSGAAACWILLLIAFPPLASPLAAGEIEFGGYTWTVRSGRGGPGPNTWEASNVWLDASTNLHLRIAHREGQWSCAEVTLQERLGFGRYEFQVQARLDRFDDHVVLGLFNYPTRDVGPDATHEIDIEFARWGRSDLPIGNFTIWPTERGLKHVTHGFPFAASDDVSTHWFDWSPDRIRFRSQPGGRAPDGTGGGANAVEWTFAPPEPGRHIAQKPMPVHLNLWLFQGRPPKNGQEVEVVIQSFRFLPAP